MFQNIIRTLSACNATTLLPRAKSSIFDFTYDVIVTSYEGGLAPNLHTSSVGFLGRCVRNSEFLRLRVTETISEKERGNLMWRLKGGADPLVPEHGTVHLFWWQIDFQHPKLPQDWNFHFLSCMQCHVREG